MNDTSPPLVFNTSAVETEFAASGYQYAGIAAVWLVVAPLDAGADPVGARGTVVVVEVVDVVPAIGETAFEAFDVAQLGRANNDAFQASVDDSSCGCHSPGGFAR